MDKVVRVNNREVKLTNLEKVIWPQDGFTKADLIKYYTDISPYVLPFLYNRPFVMSRYPDGIDSESFYQKNIPGYAPQWIETYPVVSGSSQKVTRHILCNNLETLVWLANQCCIELHVWLNTIDSMNMPDIAVFDLDPMPPLTFNDSVKTALLIKAALDQFGLAGYPKSSGATGIHIFLPLIPKYTYAEIRKFVLYIFRFINKIVPDKTTLERSVKKRASKVYLDYLQNTSGKTMAWHYSLRPLPGAPVSTPLTWHELENTAHESICNIKTIFKRLKSSGDLFDDLKNKRQNIDHILKLTAGS